ncbi:MAG TPA: anthrone oxygenase family protein [Vicinamibacteria bacterium]|nr:anthrone oxygenase family protein [Vicinamibacteria bacterium]
MNDRVFVVLTFASALGCGLTAGVFFAFSSFVMKALARLPVPQGIAAMNSINVLAVNPLFMTALFATAGACLLVAFWTLVAWQRPGGAYLLVGAVFYVVGTVLVTIVFNVPRNNALGAVNPSSADGARLWADYVTSWTAWNHVRTIAALVAAALFTFGLCVTHVR